MRRAVLAAAALFALQGHAGAQSPPLPLRPLTMTHAPGPRHFTSDHKGVFNGAPVRYRAKVFETSVRDGEGRPAADLVSYSYVAQDRPATGRPVVFVFNGGPGHASVFLHLGALGPRILTPVLEGGVAHAPVIDNPLSPPDVADLVFLDDPGGGFSKVRPGADTDWLYSVDGDAEVMSQAVIDWLQRHDRTGSPVFLYGESYGTVRAVVMARDLRRSPAKVEVAGVMLGGNSLGYRQRGQMPDILYQANALQMMASMAWHYGKIDKGQSWSQAVEKARRFGQGEYISALMKGDGLDTATRDRVVAQLPALIGIPESYFRAHRTIVVADFKRELLRDRGVMLDGDDGRIRLPAEATAADSRAPGLFAEQMEAYLATELGVPSQGTYVAEARELNPVWNYRVRGASAPDATLAQAMRDNPRLRVLLVQGRYDTLTIPGNSEYIMSQAHLPAGRYGAAYYDGGHFLQPQPEIMARIRAFVLERE